MIPGIILLGLLSAFAVGPASFSIIQSLIQSKTWPWKAIAGFLLGDIIYISLALSLLKTPLLDNQVIRIVLTLLTVVFLVTYAVRILFAKKQIEETFSTTHGFWKSLIITLSNFHLIFLYAGIFAPFTHQSAMKLALVVSAYLFAFIASFLTLLWTIQQLRNGLQTFLRKIQVIAAYGFITCSIFLSLELL